MRLKKRVNAMARKKIVFVIVEGPSDDTAIGNLLDKIFDKNKVHIEIMHCDITSDKNTTVNNIVTKCSNIIKNYAIKNHYTKQHFQQIIHLVDTDGAFIQEEKIVEDTTINNIVYSPTGIICNNIEKIKKRNIQKSSVLNRLISCNYLWVNIPYHIYYMSCNLDHVLYNKQNSSDEEKETCAYAFIKEYKDKVDDFITYITKSDFSVNGDYIETWDFIKQDNNSLQRYTNFGLCFPKNDTTDNNQ